MVGSLSGVLIGCVAPIKDLLFPQGVSGRPPGWTRRGCCTGGHVLAQ